jgi:HTH-type transcriptional regulator/antitoxin HigA
MDIRPIRNNEDHTEALNEIARLWGSKPGTPEGEKLDVLATLVCAYEDEKWPIPKATPLDMLRYAITDLGRSQKDLSEILGSRSRASEILSGKRNLTIDQIKKISREWHIPIECLIMDHEIDRKSA